MVPSYKLAVRPLPLQVVPRTHVPTAFLFIQKKRGGRHDVGDTLWTHQAHPTGRISTVSVNACARARPLAVLPVSVSFGRPGSGAESVLSIFNLAVKDTFTI